MKKTYLVITLYWNYILIAIQLRDFLAREIFDIGAEAGVIFAPVTRRCNVDEPSSLNYESHCGAAS
jgi:hypothetical protein